MELIRGRHNLKYSHRGCVATIGNFDGVHLGHQRLIFQLQKVATELQLPSCIITFDPLPHEYFVGSQQVQSRLTYFREKIHALANFNIDRVLMLKFNKGLSSLSAEEFIQAILFEGLRVHHLIVGDDFKFGKGRSGTFNTLVKSGKVLNFTVTSTDSFCIKGERVSSTRIRNHLHNGEFEEAAFLLGRPYTMEGRVVYGKQLGRTLGYPTANILLKRRKTPVHGIFVVEVTDDAQRKHFAMASLGERPSVDGGGETLLEVHLFDFNENLYGQHLKIFFLHKIRDEAKFASLKELTQAIASDEAISRHWFAHNQIRDIRQESPKPCDLS